MVKVWPAYFLPAVSTEPCRRPSSGGVDDRHMRILGDYSRRRNLRHESRFRASQAGSWRAV